MIMKTKFKFLNAISKVFNFALKIFCFLTQNQIVFFSTNVSDLLSLTMCNLYFSCTLTLKSICTNTLNSLLILFKPLSFLVFLNEPFHEKESPSLPTKIYPEVQNSCVSFQCLLLCLLFSLLRLSPSKCGIVQPLFFSPHPATFFKCKHVLLTCK